MKFWHCVINTKETKDTQGREYYFDNMKGLLAVSVVMGHFLQPFVDEYGKVRIIFICIYLFHMAAFFFISGYFSKNFVKDGKIKISRLIYIVTLYCIMQIFFGFFESAVLGKKISFSMFEGRMALWYLMVLAELTATLPFIVLMKKSAVMITALLLGILIGIDNASGHFLSISRLLVYAPFFYAGYFMTRIELEKVKKKSFAGILGGGVLGIVIFVCVRYRHIALGLLSGKNSYKALGYSQGEGMLYRGGLYMAAIILIGALVCFTPRFKTCFAYLGKNSMQIYILHSLIILVFLHYDLDHYFQGINYYYPYMVIILAFILSLILALPIFKVPFKGIQYLSDWCSRCVLK